MPNQFYIVRLQMCFMYTLSCMNRFMITIRVQQMSIKFLETQRKKDRSSATGPQADYYITFLNL